MVNAAPTPKMRLILGGTRTGTKAAPTPKMGLSLGAMWASINAAPTPKMGINLGGVHRDGGSPHPSNLAPFGAHQEDKHNPGPAVVPWGWEGGAAWPGGGPHLQITDVEVLLVDVGGVGAPRQPRQRGQVAAVAAHGLDDEHAPLGARRRLLDAVAGLQGSKKRFPWWGRRLINGTTN